jgi:hypothetical protein
MMFIRRLVTYLLFTGFWDRNTWNTFPGSENIAIIFFNQSIIYSLSKHDVTIIDKLSKLLEIQGGAVNHGLKRFFFNV